MPTDRTILSSLVFDVIRQFGEEMDHDGLKNPDEQTPLMGEKSGMDSIALVSLIVEVETRVGEVTGQDLVLADDQAMSLRRSPFRRAGTLIDYLVERLGE